MCVCVWFNGEGMNGVDKINDVLRRRKEATVQRG